MPSRKRVRRLFLHIRFILFDHATYHLTANTATVGTCHGRPAVLADSIGDPELGSNLKFHLIQGIFCCRIDRFSASGHIRFTSFAVV